MTTVVAPPERSVTATMGGETKGWLEQATLALFIIGLRRWLGTDNPATWRGHRMVLDKGLGGLPAQEPSMTCTLMLPSLRACSLT